MKVIIITGTPGTGKTTLARALSKKLNYLHIDVNEIIKKYKISAAYDKKRKTKIIDIKKLNRCLLKELNNFKSLYKESLLKINNKSKKSINKKIIKKIKNKKIIKRGVIVDSHLSHYLPKKYVDLCIVAKCDLKVLEKRLKKKKYNKGKIRENLDAEIFDVCLNEARELKHNIIVIDTTKGIKTLLDFIVKKIIGK